MNYLIYYIENHRDVLPLTMSNLAFKSEEERLHSIVHLRTGLLALTPLGEIDVNNLTPPENYAKKYLNSARSNHYGKTWKIKNSKYNSKRKIEK